MFECRNCGGQMKFSIKDQELVCGFCDTHADPYSYENKVKDAREEQFFEITIFTCPQCGGEIQSTDTSVAEFCSFCGSSTVLYSRISNEKRPKYIIPFKLSKDDCKNAYAKATKRAIFAPKAFKDVKFIDSFRGIYMPYWSLYITQQNKLKINGVHSYKRGNYLITDYYRLEGHLDAHYKGLSYDASSSFSDDISRAVAPFDVKDMQVFTPSYFSGFYADSPDVPVDIYRDEATKTITGISNKYIQKTFSQCEFDELTEFDLNTVTEAVDLSMFPVWFMSYKNGDRITYITVNGQSGRVAVNFPADIKKYLLFSFLLSIPIFLLLNPFFTVVPITLLRVIGFFLMFAVIIACVETIKIAKKENNEDDWGLQWKNGEEIRKKREVPRKIKKIFKNKKFIVVVIFVGIYFALWLCGDWGRLKKNVYLADVCTTICLLIAEITSLIGILKIKKVPKKVGLGGFVASIIVSVIVCFITWSKVVSDLYYYGAAIACLLVIFGMIRAIIVQYNILSSKRLPQFDKKGGDDRA